MVNAKMSGFKAEWPPYLSGEDGYVKVALAIARGIVLTTQAIKTEQPDAVTVQVEALWYTYTKDPSLEARAALDNSRQYLCFDLVTGRMDESHDLAEYLHEHGMTDSDLNWFQRNCVSFDVFGANYYPWSHAELKLKPDGKAYTVVRRASGHKIELVLREAWDRYHMPIMITETSSNGDVKARAKWMDDTIATVGALRREGIPILGYTWFPLFTMVDWKYRKGRRTLDKYLVHLGLYDAALEKDGVLRRNETLLVKHFQTHMQQQLPPVGKPYSRSISSPRTRLSLDGTWTFSLTPIEKTANTSKIRVPSPWQADDRFRDHTGEAWYQREFTLPADWLESNRIVILGFGAVDYFAEVWLNGIRIGEHEGGYLPFEFDVTAAARPGTNSLTVRVDDPLEIFPEIPHGKQSWYGMLSGIWQPVWIESRAKNHIQRVKISTNGEQVSVETTGQGDFVTGLTAEIIGSDGEIVAQIKTDTPRFSLRVEQPRLWSPDDPNLYTLRLYTASDELTDTFGFRSIETRDGQILLNGRPFYLRGALDQDYYPDLIYTPPSLEYIERQFRQAKEMGLNCLRVHIKVADPRYYEAADKVGLLIWTELPNHTVLTEDAKRRARETLAGMLERDGNHPSIAIWTIINESWGIDLTDPSQRAWLSETYRWFKQLDPTRLVVGNSACWSNFHVVTDIADFHTYYDMPDNHEKWQKWTETYARRPWWLFAHEYTEHSSWREFILDPWYLSERPRAADVLPKGDEPLLVSEFGNWGLPDIQKLSEGNGGKAPWWFESGHDWSGGIVYPHGIERRFQEYHLNRVFPSLSALTEASQWLQFDALKFQIENMRTHANLQGYVITELTDVHWESNGLLDMYRNPKVHYSRLSALNSADLLIPAWERLTYFSGEAGVVSVLFSHLSEINTRMAVLQWKIHLGEKAVEHGEIAAGECTPFEITELGQACFNAPAVDQPEAARLELNLLNEERLIASTEQELYIFPELSSIGDNFPVFAPEFHPLLEKLGYTLTEDVAKAQVAVVTTLDDSLRDYILHGGRVLLLAESKSALQMYIPNLEIKAREETVWQGDWANSLGWHLFDHLPTGRIVNFAFAGLTPEFVLGKFVPRDFAFDVYAGLFVGWLHKPMPVVARRRVGQGEVLVSTFRLSRHLASNPLAQYLFAELVKLAQGSAKVPN
jgi:hypothetical protein